jgi:hypothetical protein
MGMMFRALPLGLPMRPILQAYSDANWAESDDRISTSGIVIRLIDESEMGEENIQPGDVIFYQCKRQDNITMSSGEAELVAACTCSLKIVLLRRLMASLRFKQCSPTILFEDNTACISMATGDGISQRSKHIDVKYFKLKELVKSGEINLIYLSTKKMTADLLTKNLARPLFLIHRTSLGMIN